MELYIQVENGQTVNHPALAANLIAAFGEIPFNWKPFLRIVSPEEPIGPIQRRVLTYISNPNGGWMDCWSVEYVPVDEKIKILANIELYPPLDSTGNQIPHAVLDYTNGFWKIYDTAEEAVQAIANRI